ncbi:MAG: tyrosine-type recombinase/integrase [Proteobacteria bacterium]|nr:tyrosine-type recombinase/integrase [Pseudomonadota bacterium]
MTDQICFHTSYQLKGNFYQGFPGKSELFTQVDPEKPVPPSSPPEKNEVSVSVRKEQQRKRTFERILAMIKEENLPGEELAINFIQNKYRRNCKVGTLCCNGTALRYFLALLKSSSQSIHEITREDIEAFIEHEQDRGIGIRSVRNRMQCAYSFVRYLVEEQIIDSEILTRRIRLKQPVSLPRAMDPEDLKILIPLIDHPRDRAMILLLLRTGMRIGELLDLQVTDISMSEKKVLIYMGEKNSRGRVVYFSEDAEEALKEWLESRDPQKKTLFYAGNGFTMSYVTARLILFKYLERAGLTHKKYSPHCLRHTFATELLNAGLRLEVLQQLLGHSSLEVTRQYARLTDKTREEEYFRAMSLIERGEVNGHF